MAREGGAQAGTLEDGVARGEAWDERAHHRCAGRSSVRHDLVMRVQALLEAELPSRSQPARTGSMTALDWHLPYAGWNLP
jgi:hypothetical protein